jgi:hypothetical protein
MICREYNGTSESYEFFYSCKYTSADRYNWQQARLTLPYTETEFMPLQFFLELPKKEEPKVDSVIEFDPYEDPLLSEVKRMANPTSWEVRKAFNIGKSRADKLINLSRTYV